MSELLFLRYAGDSGTTSDSGSGGEVGSKQINGSHHDAAQENEVNAKREQLFIEAHSPTIAFVTPYF